MGVQVPIAPLVDWSSGVPFVGGIRPEFFSAFATIPLIAGFLMASYFLIYEVTSTPKSRNIVKEIVIAAPASLLLGFGTFYLILAAGIYL